MLVGTKRGPLWRCVSTVKSSDQSNQCETNSPTSLRPLSPFSPGVKLASASEFPNLFDLEQREPVAHSFLSSDCNRLGGVVSEFGVHCLLLTHQ
jgi:hypothetical protein